MEAKWLVIFVLQGTVDFEVGYSCIVGNLEVLLVR